MPCTAPPEAPAEPTTVRTDCAAYAPGAALDLRVQNGGEHVFEYGPCGVALERREGEAWVKAEPLCQFEQAEPATRDVVVLCCQSFSILMWPHSRDTMRLYLDPDVRPGAYRVQVHAGLEGVGPDGIQRDTLVHSNVFDVR